MQILELEIRNVGPIKAFKISPDGKRIVIGGPNESGKTTAVEGIADIFRKKQDRKTTLRRGADKGHVILDLGDVIITRTLDDKGKDALEIKNKNGAVFSSAPAIVKTLWHHLGFDLMKFFRSTEKEQAQILGEIAGVDLLKMAADRDVVFKERTGINRLAKSLQARADGYDVPEGTPSEMVDVDALEAERREGDAYNSETARLADTVEIIKANHATESSRVKAAADRASAVIGGAKRDNHEAIQQLEAELAKAREGDHIKLLEKSAKDDADEADDVLGVMAERIKNGTKIVAERNSVDVAPIIESIAKAREVNSHVAKAKAKADIEASAKAERGKSQGLTEKLEEMDATRDKSIADADLPIDGIGIEEGRVTWNGAPFKELSSGRAIDVAVSLSIAQNKDVKVSVIANWGELDENMRKIVNDRTDAAGVQIVSTVVGTHDPDVTVTIEEGGE